MSGLATFDPATAVVCPGCDRPPNPAGHSCWGYWRRWFAGGGLASCSCARCDGASGAASIPGDRAAMRRRGLVA